MHRTQKDEYVSIVGNMFIEKPGNIIARIAMIMLGLN